MIKYLRLLSLILVLGGQEVAYSICPTIFQAAQRMNSMSEGTPFTFVGPDGEETGYIKGVFRDKNRRQFFHYVGKDGQERVRYVSDIDPTTFKSSSDQLSKGDDFSITSASGSTYEGKFIEKLVIDEVEKIRYINRKTGQERFLVLGRLDEGTLKVQPKSRQIDTLPMKEIDPPDDTLADGFSGDTLDDTFVDGLPGDTAFGRSPASVGLSKPAIHIPGVELPSTSSKVAKMMMEDLGDGNKVYRAVDKEGNVMWQMRVEPATVYDGYEEEGLYLYEIFGPDGKTSFGTVGFDCTITPSHPCAQLNNFDINLSKGKGRGIATEAMAIIMNTHPKPQKIISQLTLDNSGALMKNLPKVTDRKWDDDPMEVFAYAFGETPAGKIRFKQRLQSRAYYEVEGEKIYISKESLQTPEARAEVIERLNNNSIKFESFSSTDGQVGLIGRPKINKTTTAQARSAIALSDEARAYQSQWYEYLETFGDKIDSGKLKRYFDACGTTNPDCIDQLTKLSHDISKIQANPEEFRYFLGDPEMYLTQYLPLRDKYPLGELISEGGAYGRVFCLGSDCNKVVKVPFGEAGLKSMDEERRVAKLFDEQGINYAKIHNSEGGFLVKDKIVGKTADDIADSGYSDKQIDGLVDLFFKSERTGPLKDRLDLKSDNIIWDSKEDKWVIIDNGLSPGGNGDIHSPKDAPSFWHGGFFRDSNSNYTDTLIKDFNKFCSKISERKRNLGSISGMEFSVSCSEQIKSAKEMMEFLK